MCPSRPRATLSGAWALALACWAFPSPARGEVAVLTMTPGPRLFERFGHTALVVGPRGYNFGTFDGDDPHLVRKFLGRALPYWLSVAPREAIFEQYRNRQVTVQVLALSAVEEAQLAARLEENARPENSRYRYDFFLDNCSTRVRDAVDRVTGGAVARAGAAAGRASFRRHVEDVLAGPPLLGAAVSLLLNASTDRPTTRSQEAFLPRELLRLLEGTHRGDGRPLVVETRVWTGPELAPAGAQGARRGRLVDLGAALCVWGPLPLVAAAGAMRRRRHPGGRLLGATLLVGGLLGGLLGAALVVAALTPYPCARSNANLLLLHPLLLALVPAGAALLAGRPASATPVRLAQGVLLLSASVVLVDLAAHVVGLARQHHVGLAVAALAWYVAGWLALQRCREAQAGPA